MGNVTVGMPSSSTGCVENDRVGWGGELADLKDVDMLKYSNQLAPRAEQVGTRTPRLWSKCRRENATRPRGYRSGGQIGGEGER